MSPSAAGTSIRFDALATRIPAHAIALLRAQKNLTTIPESPHKGYATVFKTPW